MPYVPKTRLGVAMSVLLLAVVIFGTSFLLLDRYGSAPMSKVTIQMSEAGFAPAKRTVPPHTTVVFENTGTEEHWPATDSHPTHNGYDGTSLDEHCGVGAVPTFDSCGAVAAGETWSFRFEKAGTFTFHDHFWPHLQGQIVVEDISQDSAMMGGIVSSARQVGWQLARGIANLLGGQSERSALLTGSAEENFTHTLLIRYEEILVETNPRNAIRVLQADASDNSAVQAQCHDILHHLGRTAYDKYGSFQAAVAFQSDYCNSGYIHGLFEAYFTSADEPLAGLVEQCNAYGAVNGRAFDTWQCHHGIGHGFMYLTGGDLDESLALCAEGLNATAAASCQNGVYMEVFNSEVLAKEETYVDPDNPAATCQSRSVAQSDCYYYLPTYLSQTKSMTFAEIFTACQDVTSPNLHACVAGVGGEAMKRNMRNPNAVFALCEEAGSVRHQHMCAQGAVSMYLNQTASLQAGQDMCTNTPRKFQRSCHAVVAERQSFFARPELDTPKTNPDDLGNS